MPFLPGVFQVRNQAEVEAAMNAVPVPCDSVTLHWAGQGLRRVEYVPTQRGNLMPSLSPLPQRFHHDGRECICRRCRNAGDYVHYTRVGLRAIGIEPQYRPRPEPPSPLPETMTPVPSWEAGRYTYFTPAELRAAHERLPQPESNRPLGLNDWHVVSTPLSYEPFDEGIERVQEGIYYQHPTPYQGLRSGTAIALANEQALRTQQGDPGWRAVYDGYDFIRIGGNDGDRRDTASTTNQSDGTSEGEEISSSDAAALNWFRRI